MSSRQIRKVFGSGEDDLMVEPASEDEKPVVFNNPRRGIKNPYELLNDVSESEAKEDDGQAEDEDGGKKSADSSKMDEDNQITKKKKKRKRAGKNKKKLAVADSEATEDEVDGALKARLSLNEIKSGGNSRTAKSAQNDAEFERLFALDTKYLSTEFELRKIFGSKVLNLERGKRNQRRLARNILIHPKDTWPPASFSGLSMQYLSNNGKYLLWKFCHSPEYQAVQRNFMRAVDSLQIESVMAIMKSHAYHIDSHLQMSEMAKSGEDMQVAAELIETALHGMETAFDSRFSLISPFNRLEYKYQENRSFFILLFKHLTFVGQRACYRTALELCKRLLTLDSDNDPLCATLMIDFYALKSNEYKWLIDLFNFWEPIKNLSQLPNFAYSAALASQLLYLESQNPGPKEKTKSKDGTSNKHTRSMSKEELEDLSRTSDKLLQYALLMFPSVLRPLMDKCSIQGDSRSSSHPYFNCISPNAQSRALKLLCELYVWRCHHVWKDQRIFSWLEKNVTAALDAVDAKDPLVQDYDEKRKRRYQGTPRNIIRHVILTDNKDLTINLPPDLSKEPILNYDPLPPPDSVNIYTYQRQVTSPESQSRQGLVNLLVNSFLYDLGGGEGAQGGRNLAEAEARNQLNNAAVGAGLQQSVTALLDAMRDLLTNVRPRADRGEDAADEGDESEGDA